MKNKQFISALTIAGFDGSGGAGMQADLKTFSALGCYGMSVLTALPIQNTCGVSNCYQLPLAALEEQLESIFSDITPDVIKIGMLFNQDIIRLVSRYLEKYAANIPIVLDPVMIAKSGDYLLQPTAIDGLKKHLIPLATVITPNLNEAQALSGTTIVTGDDMLKSARIIQKLGAANVLLKGGHLNGNDCADLLLGKTNSQWLHAPRINTVNTHGTGCTLAAAIAANLAHGLNLTSSCHNAKHYLQQALVSYQQLKIGHGHGPVNHFHHWW